MDYLKQQKQQLAQAGGLMDSFVKSQQEDAKRKRAAAEAQIAVPDLIQDLTKRTSDLINVAEAQKTLAESTDTLTRRLVRLTWGLLLLTVALLVKEALPLKHESGTQKTQGAQPAGGAYAAPVAGAASAHP